MSASAGSRACAQAEERKPADGAGHAAIRLFGWRAVLRERFSALSKTELARWGYIFRMVLAALLSLWLSLFLELEQPYTAMTTVLVIMQPTSGAVLSKSTFRVLGTLAGCFVPLIIFSLFRQQPPLYVAVLALFVGGCIFGSAKTRNTHSYAFVLTAYTATLVTLPHLPGNTDIFDSAVLRGSEVLVGLICSIIVNELFFPETVARVFDVNVKGRFTAFDEFVCDALASGRFDQEKAQQRQLDFIKAVTMLETYGASIAYEAASTVEKRHVHLFATDFMSVTSSFYSLASFFERIQSLPADAGGAFFKEYGERIVSALKPGGKSAVLVEDAKSAAAALSRVQKEASRQAASLLSTMTGRERDILSGGVYLFSRFLTDMRGYLMHYVALTEKKRVNTRTRRIFARSGTDSGIALALGLKTSLSLVLLCLFWWGSSSSSGVNAAICGMVCCAFLSALPHPVKLVIDSIKAFALGSAAGLVYAFLILPQVSDFAVLAVTILPFVMLAPWLGTSSNPALGVPYGFTFFNVANPGLYFNVRPDSLVSSCFEQMFGAVVAVVVLSVVLPSGGRWWKRHLGKAMRRAADLACRTRLFIARQKVEARVRDVLLQFYASPFPSAKEKQEMLRRALLINQLSNIVIDMRKCARNKGCSAFERQTLEKLLIALEAFFARPDSKKYEAIMTAFDRAGDVLKSDYQGGFFYYSLHADTRTVLDMARERLKQCVYLFLPQSAFEKGGRENA